MGLFSAVRVPVPRVRFARVAFVGGCLTWASAACSVADIAGTSEGADATEDDASVSTASKSKGKTTSQGDKAGCAGSATPTSTGALPDPSTLEACACSSGGQARCVTEGVPDDLGKNLASCGGGVCVPDTVLTTGRLEACHSSKKVLGKTLGDGRCVSLCVPKVAEGASLLDRGDGDACAADERCVPCVNPADGQSSGLCEIEPIEVGPSAPAPAGPCEDDTTGDPSTPSPGDTPTEPAPEPPVTGDCCGGAGKCLPGVGAPLSVWGDGDGACDFVGEICAPLVADPPKCSASALAGSYTGVCLSECFVEALTLDIFEAGRGSCSSARGEMCVPCNMHGSPTNAPGCP